MRSVRWLGLFGLYIGAQLVALALAVPFRSAGLSSGSNPSSLTTPLVLIAAVIVAPIVILLLARRQGLLVGLRHLLLIAIAGALYFTVLESLLVALPAGWLLAPTSAEIALVPAVPLAAIVAAGLYLALLMDPQWYVVDLAGFVAAGGLIAILGISFTILPVFLLLIALAVYDAIAVYRTKHMIRLADIVTEMKLPILMVMPESADYDYAAAPPLSETRKVPMEERAATFMGLGDVVIPGILVVSAFVWLPSSPKILGLSASLWVALGALVGSLIGYAVLMRRVSRGEAQAGLPFLNGGALVGYIVTFLLIYHSATFGLTGGL